VCTAVSSEFGKIRRADLTVLTLEVTTDQPDPGTNESCRSEQPDLARQRVRRDLHLKTKPPQSRSQRRYLDKPPAGNEPEMFLPRPSLRPKHLGRYDHAKRWANQGARRFFPSPLPQNEHDTLSKRFGSRQNRRVVEAEGINQRRHRRQDFGSRRRPGHRRTNSNRRCPKKCSSRWPDRGPLKVQSIATTERDQ